METRPANPYFADMMAYVPAAAKFAAALILFYALALLVLWAAQRRLIYPGTMLRQAEAVVPAGYRLVALDTEDGLTLHAGWRPGAPGMPTAVFFHGNGATMKWAGHVVAPLAAAGFGVLLPEYRGYGGNPGFPSEAGLYADGRAAMAWLHARGVSPANIVLVGNSLGSGVAVQLAAEVPPRALVIISGFTRLPDVAQGKLRWAPAKWLVRDRFDNLAKIGRVRAPVLLLHGARDRLIPFAHAEAMAAAHPAAQLLRFAGYGHELAWRPEAGAAVARWLSQGQGVGYRVEQR